ncbi:MAG TPA: adenylosuccinate lyase [Polyangiaceae bacterium]|nr:adenylosuccinate lyase [Polyangiaceae bacterium]
MIPRYTPKDFAELWSDKTRYQTWLDVELAACEALESAGHVPRGTAAAIRAKNLVLDPAAIDRIEQKTRHDVIAFLTHVEELAGDPARWLHRGMTSSDVLDTSLACLLVRATDLLLARTDTLAEKLAQRAREHARTPMIGRSHGIHAEPTTFGVALAGHLAEIRRGRARLARAREEIAVGKIAGAVGTYAHLSPEIEAEALRKLGLAAETVSTQVVARDRHAAFFAALALLAAGIERLATNVRHWQRTEVGEAEERFSAGQKGSSAMPHKRNPVLSENLCGLARVVRAAVTPALENVALWHERDISHSSVERMLAPDATATLGFMLERAAGLVEGLVVYPERLDQNLARSGGLFFSEAVMLALVEKGLARQAAYEIVQRSAMGAFRGEGEFRALLGADSDITSRLTPSELDGCFDLEHALRYAEALVERATRT